MKTVGIIGGLGPETTSEFYLDLVFSCAKKVHFDQLFLGQDLLGNMDLGASVDSMT